MLPVALADAAEHRGVRFRQRPERVIAAPVALSTLVWRIHLPDFASRLQRRRRGGKVCALSAQSAFVRRATRSWKSVRSTAAPMAFKLFDTTRCTCLDDSRFKRQRKAIFQNTLVLRAFVLMPNFTDSGFAVLCMAGLRVRPKARGRRACTRREEFETPGVDS